MKSITNDSLQGFEIHINTPKGNVTRWLKPKETIVVPSYYITEQVKNMQKMQLLRLKNA
tara:strand:+ start:1802 stop:1978 length:177 start_codon:yes stop_codon:yes gene_type:complete